MRLRNEGGLKALFLHWGPGCNAEVERRWFGTQTEIDWWDQPKVHQGPQAFGKMIAAAQSRLDTLFEMAGKPVHLFAHSFGGKLVQALAESSPEKIGGITLLTCNSDPWMAYVNFADFLSRFKSELKEASKKANESRHPDDLWKLVQLIMQVPDFPIYYWKNETARTRHAGLSQGVEFLDFAMFEQVMNEFTGAVAKPKKLTLPKGVKVRCFFGDGDPMIDAAAEAKAWERVFPGCESTTVPNSGHFVHFEAAPSVWLGELTSSFRL